jgi:endonuclease/exonuclease/phosphatase family metal-dependent hydrolase
MHRLNFVLTLIGSVALLPTIGSPVRAGQAAETFRVATYNLENYLETAQGTRPAKSPEAKSQLRTHILALRPDVLALQEVGGLNALLELRDTLQTAGLKYPHWEWVTGFDTTIQVAVLSQFPIVARRPHTNENYLLFGRRFRVSRGFAEIDIRINPRYVFTLITAHLKSRRPVPEANEAEMREQEALLLRERINAVLTARPNANLVVLGDLNDTQETPAVKTVMGRGTRALVDTRPAERHGDSAFRAASNSESRAVTWTYFYGKTDTYSRIDYIFLSRGMAREWDRSGTFVLSNPNWGVASDHRPLVATFLAEEK